MIACPQTTTQNVLEHGCAVHTEYLRLLKQIEQNNYSELPEWIKTYSPEILNSLSEFDSNQIKNYHIYHDCGKPFCRVVDDEGKQHFPDHASLSAETYYSLTKNTLVSSWIKHDMDTHLLKAEEITSFCKLDGCIVLLITALSEIFANANLFGGTKSISFKIKYKHIDRRGKAICHHLWGQNV